MKTPSQPKPTQIFISYSTDDRVAVDRLVKDLENRHYPLWLDKNPTRGLDVGDYLEEKLVKEVKASRMVIACLSPKYLESKYCKLEIDTARANNIPIVPVLIRKIDPESPQLEAFGLQKRLYSDLPLDYEAGLSRLIEVLPRPAFPLMFYVQRVALGVAGVLAITLVALLISLGLQYLQSITPTEAPPITPTVEDISRFDVQVAVMPFLIDPQIDPNQSAEIRDIVVNFSSDLNELENDPDTTVTVGVRTADQFPPIDGETPTERETNAAAFALDGRYEIVVYGWVTLLEDGQIEIQPVYYVPPDAFPDAVEITGSQRFGKPITLRRVTGGSIAQQVIEQLHVRSQALAYVIRGTSFYIDNSYEKALELFDRAAELEGWDATDGREVLDVLRANAHWQIARIAISECRPEDALPDLYAAETLYNSAITAVDPPGDNAPGNARAYAGRADVTAILALWADLENVVDCESLYGDVGLLDSALRDLDRAINSADFLDLPDVLQAHIQVNRVRVTNSRLIVYNESTDADNLESWLNTVEFASASVIRLYENDPADPSLIAAAFEAYLNRGFIRIEWSGSETCDESGEADLEAAAELPDIPAHRLFFVYDSLARCAELAGDTEAALTYYQLALEYAQTDFDRQNTTCYIAALENPDAAPAPECVFDEVLEESPDDSTAEAPVESTVEPTDEATPESESS